MSRWAGTNPSREQDPACRRSPARPERSEDLRAVERQQVAARLAVVGQEPVMASRPREHQQDNGGSWIVALLQPQATLQRLCVRDARLEIGEARHVASGDHRVPCPKVARNRQPNLPSNGERSAQYSEQALEHAQRPGVAQRRCDGIEPHRCPQAENPSRAADLHDVRTSDCAALEATPLRSRHACRASRPRLAQPGRESRVAQLSRDDTRQIACIRETQLEPTATRCHAASLRSGAWWWRTSGLPQPVLAWRR